jgi:hypothetical protein
MKFYSVIGLVFLVYAVAVFAQTEDAARGQIISAYKQLRIDHVKRVEDRKLIEDLNKIIFLLETNVGKARQVKQGLIREFVIDLKGRHQRMQSSGKFDSSVFEAFKAFGKKYNDGFFRAKFGL